MSDIQFSVKNMSSNGRGIATNDNVAGALLDNTYYEAGQAKQLVARANSSGVGDVTTTPFMGRSERHFPVKAGQVLEVY